jgi:hypothetical protein
MPATTPPDHLADCRTAAEAVMAAEKALAAHQQVMDDAVAALRPSHLLGQDPGHWLVSRILSCSADLATGTALDHRLAVGTTSSEVFHTLDPFDFGDLTECRRPTRGMVVVSTKGRRWCQACSNAKG